MRGNIKSKEIEEFQNNILLIMKAFNRPVTIGEISQEVDVSYYVTEQNIDTLKLEGKIIELVSKKGNEKYYVLANKNNSINEELSQKYVDMASALEKQYKEIKEENENLKNKIDKIYTNMISLMGIFVAIFALIIINVESIGTFAANANSSDEMFINLVILNIPLVISLIVLSILIGALTNLPRR